MSQEMRALVAAAIRPAARNPCSFNAAPRIKIMVFRPDLSALAAWSIASVETTAGIGLGKAANRPIIPGEDRRIELRLRMERIAEDVVQQCHLRSLLSGIIAHGIPFLHHAIEELQHAIGEPAFLVWLAKATACALGGLVVGAVVAQAVGLISKLRPAKNKA